MAAFQYLNKAWDAREGHFIRKCSDRTRDNGFQLRAHLDYVLGKNSLLCVWLHWNRLLREAADAPTSSVEGQAGQGLSNLV